MKIALGLLLVALLLLLTEMWIFRDTKGAYRFRAYAWQAIGLVLAIAWFIIARLAWDQFMQG